MFWTSEKVRMGREGQGVFGFVLFLVGIVLVRGKLEECQKIQLSSNDLMLNCQLRTINSEFDKTNFTYQGISGDSVVSLNLECSDVLFYQSSLQAGSLSHFSRLGSLHIEHCKLSRLPPSVFAGLSLLKNLTLRTHNTVSTAINLFILSVEFYIQIHLHTFF